MIKARELLYEFDRRLHRIKSNFSGKISVEKKDSYLNEGLMILYENLVSKAEINSATRNELREFEEKKVSLDCDNSKFDDCCLATLPKGFYKLLRQTTIAKKGDCEQRKLLTHIAQSEDLDEMLKDPYWKPSFEWEETIADEGKDGLYVFHNGEFEVTDVVIDYYRKPGKICTPSATSDGFYISASGETISKDCDLDTDDTFKWRKLVDIAVLIALRDYSDFPEYESQVSKILQVEQLHTT